MNDVANLTCPKCESPMRSYERNGITIDQCTGCRGIFLDRGELERLVDAEGAHYTTGGDGDYESRRGEGFRKGGERKKKKRGFLEDFLDFG